MIEDALRNKLLDNTNLTALIADRLFVQEAPQGVARPYVVYLVVSLNPEYCQGESTDHIIIQYSCFAERHSESRAIANIIRQDLNGFSGELEGIKIPSIVFDSQGVNIREKDSRLAHISYDFRIILNNT